MADAQIRTPTTRTPTEIMTTYLAEVGGKRRYHLIDEIALQDMVDEANQAFGGPAGRAGLVAHVKGFHKNITQTTSEAHNIVGGKDQVMAHWSFTGRHTGPWLGRAPTGQMISANVFSFFTLKGGLISRYRLWMCAEMDEVLIFDSSRALAAAKG